MPLINKNVILNAVVVFLAFLMLLCLAYLPLITSGYLFQDDYTGIIWNRASFTTHPYYLNTMQAGRWIAALLIPLEQHWISTHSSAYSRFFNVMLLSVISSLNFYWLKSLKYPVVASFVVAVVISTLPPFEACVFNLTSAFIALSVILGQLSCIFLIKGLDESILKYKVGILGVAIILLLVGQFTYVSGVSYFLTFLMIYLLAPATLLGKPLIERCVLLTVLFLVSLVIYYMGTILALRILHLPSSSDPGRGLGINHDVLGQLWYYLTKIIPKTLNFWYIDFSHHPQDDLLTIVITIMVLSAALIGARSLLASKILAQPQDKQKLLLCAIMLLLFIIPLSAVFPLAAVPGREVPYRTLDAHMAMGFMLAFWGVVYGGKQVLQSYRSWVWMKPYAGLMMVSFALIYCSFLMERHIVRPANIERDYVRETIIRNHINPTDDYINIALRRDLSRITFMSFLKEGDWHDDGWDISNTYFFWSAALTVNILRDMGVDMSQAVFTTENHVEWPHGQITILVKPEDKAPKGAILIDMHDLFTLGTGL